MVEQDDLGDLPGTVIIQRSGHPAVPIYDGRWLGPVPADEDPNGLRVMRSWFTPSITQKKKPRSGRK